jgi:uncharacterized Zn finger protein
MARKSYGTTWWGQQWLQALSNIDFSNRLPRGRSYANTGKVRSVEVKGNSIHAKVQGTQPSPYRVDISVPIFSKEENQRLVGEVARNPALVAKLLNRELPPELLQFAEKQKIHVFPHSWRDFSMHCSCPDFAVPCKHLAAVIYTLADEIDRNPFMVFELHGLDLVKALEDKNIHVADQQTERITKAASLLADPVAASLKPEVAQPEPIDFTSIPGIGADILTLFKPHPLFFNGDFKEVVQKLYAGAAKAAVKLLNGNLIPRKLAYTIEPEDQLQLVFDENLLFRQLAVFDKKNKEKTLKDARPEDLVQILMAWDPESLRRTHRHTAVLYEVFNFSLVLAKQGAIVPQLLECEAGSYRIRWQPAAIHEAVKEVFDKMAQNLPPALLTVSDGKKTYSQTPPEMLRSLCSFFIGKCLEESGSQGAESLVKIFQFTTDSQPVHFPDPDTPQLLQLWLNNFYLAHKDFVPMVKVEEVSGGHFSIDLLVEHRPQPMQPPIPLADVLQKSKYVGVKFEVLKDVMLLADFFPQLAEFVEAKGTKRLVFDEVKFVEVFLKMLPAIGLFGIRILLPKALKHLVRPQVSLLAKKSPGKDEGSFLSFGDLVNFDWQIALGEDLITVREFEKLVTNLNGIVKIRDQYVLVDEDELIKLFVKLDNPPKLGGFQALQVLLAGEYEGVKIGLSSDAAVLIRQLLQPGMVPLPKKLRATLRPYQRSGYEWMLKNTRLGFGSLIADDMGLGKTLQVIATLLKFKEEGFLQKKKALVIVPTSLLTNWRKEIEKFAPSLIAAVYHGQKRSLGVVNPDVIITTYGIVRNELELLQKMEWYCTVIDEAQNIKNPGTEQTKAVKSIPATVRIAMSGTPVENRLSEFWSIMDFTNRGYLGSPKQFSETFAKPIQKEHDRHQAELFKKITAPFILRRLKSDKTIIADLPEKIENNSYASLTPEQAAIYENVVQESMKIIYEEGDDIKRQGLVLKMITALKQICNHPFQFLKKGGTSPELSGKAVLLLSLLDTIYENNEKTLIFTQYREMGDLLSGFLADTFGKYPLFLHGGTSRNQRDEMVETFQNDPFADTFILSLKAGGTGLNLTAASNVIHYDLWWNPAVEAQATDRAYRIGQSKNVMVWRMITQGTFEEKIDEMLKMKKDLANLTVATGENWIGNLSNEELGRLVAMGV